MVDLDPTGDAKVVFTVCTMALLRFEEQEKRAPALDALVEGLAGLKTSSKFVKNIADAKLRETVTKILSLTEDASVFVLKSSPHDWLGTVIDAYSSAAREQVALFISSFESLRKEFDMRVNAEQLRASKLNKAREMLKEIKPIELASYNPSKQCLAGTRTEIIARLESWADSKEGPNLVWMYGLAGLGKSSIATSVSKRLDDRGLLAASFFCKRDSPELRDPRRVLVTIAYQLAQRWEDKAVKRLWDAYAKAVVKIMQEEINLELSNLPRLYNTLVAAPLQKLVTHEEPPKALVVVVDALDECGEEETRRQLLTYLSEITRLVPGIRTLITSRPNKDIKAYFKGIAPDLFEEIDVHKYDASEDIQVFIRQILHKSMVFEEPFDTAVDSLSKQAAGSFIWARTACTYILRGIDRNRRLELVTAGAHLAGIDNLYTAILVDSNVDVLEILACLGPIIATSMYSPLPIHSLALLVGNNPSSAKFLATAEALASFLYIDEDLGEAIRVSHTSFVDYITTPSRSREFYVNIESQNMRMSVCCLRTMLGSLRFNIAGLKTSDRHNPDCVESSDLVISADLSYSCLYWSTHISSPAMDDEHIEILRTFISGIELLYWLEALSLLGKLSSAPASLLRIVGFCSIKGTEDCAMVAKDAHRFVLSFYDAISSSTPHLYISALALCPKDSAVAGRMRSRFPGLLQVVEGEEMGWSHCLRSVSTSGPISTVSFSSERKRIVSASEYGTLQIWDLETGEAVLEPLQAHSRPVGCVAFSPDGLNVASGSADKTARVWDPETGDPATDPLTGHTAGIQSVAYSPDGRIIATGSWDKTIRIWDAESGAPIGEPWQGHSDKVLSVVFSPDGGRVASSSADTQIRLWEVRNGTTIVQPLQGHSDWVRSVGFSADCGRIVSGSQDRTVRIWCSNTGIQSMDPLRGHSGHVMSVAFSPDGNHVVSGSSDHTVRIWDAFSGALVVGPLLGHRGSVNSITVSPAGDLLISGSTDRTIRIWDMASALSAGTSTSLSTTNRGLLGVAQVAEFTTQHRFIVLGSADRTVRVWDANEGKVVLGPLEDCFDWVYSTAFNLDASIMAASSSDNTVCLWDTKTGTLAMKPFEGHSSEVAAVAFSPDGLMVASGSYDKTVRLWDLLNRAPAIVLAGHSDWVRSVDFSPDGRRIASGSHDKSIIIWDIQTRQVASKKIHGHLDCVLSVVFSPDGHCLASGSRDGTVRLWDAETGHTLVEPLSCNPHGVNRVSFSPDGKRIVSCSDDWAIRIWDANTGNLLRKSLQGHSDIITSISISLDSRYIVSSSHDHTIRIWDSGLDLQLAPQPTQCLTGTSIEILEGANGRIRVTAAELARHIEINRPGWVTTAAGYLLVWLPPEYRAVDDSLMCISDTGVHHRVVLDFTRFVHGEAWTSIVRVE
ncbi:hypothetical protein RhiJN_24452 [Ceratobasidium sp. AG-Ba]|nr:hypothetical protein RhiJN_24452 [Ceratobasidium sp. AG-Ba]